jgi:hypothetical protein
MLLPEARKVSLFPYSFIHCPVLPYPYAHR